MRQRYTNVISGKEKEHFWGIAINNMSEIALYKRYICDRENMHFCDELHTFRGVHYNTSYILLHIQQL